VGIANPEPEVDVRLRGRDRVVGSARQRLRFADQCAAGSWLLRRPYDGRHALPQRQGHVPAPLDGVRVHPGRRAGSASVHH